jgi:carboxypeptidase C (cathepsin A)
MRWVEKLYYKDSEVFDKTPFQTWKVNGNVAGSYKKAGKLELKIVNNAGHMIPMDQG